MHSTQNFNTPIILLLLYRLFFFVLFVVGSWGHTADCIQSRVITFVRRSLVFVPGVWVKCERFPHEKQAPAPAQEQLGGVVRYTTVTAVPRLCWETNEMLTAVRVSYTYRVFVLTSRQWRGWWRVCLCIFSVARVCVNVCFPCLVAFLFMLSTLPNLREEGRRSRFAIAMLPTIPPRPPLQGQASSVTSFLRRIYIAKQPTRTSRYIKKLIKRRKIS